MPNAFGLDVWASGVQGRVERAGGSTMVTTVLLHDSDVATVLSCLRVGHQGEALVIVCNGASSGVAVACSSMRAMLVDWTKRTSTTTAVLCCSQCLYPTVLSQAGCGAAVGSRGRGEVEPRGSRIADGSSGGSLLTEHAEANSIAGRIIIKTSGEALGPVGTALHGYVVESGRHAATLLVPR